ncbi:Duplicated ATPase component of energizing module of predicted ECF transporter [Clostridiaceae bacterium JG1575]|nr:Duplicated ATPase component of energizing module of predicted ECF transporter [Clostridiaceae bacterium JG1575]
MVRFESVSFTYPQGTKALKDVSFEAKEGECILLCGPSGCGKTTLLRLINGLIPHYDRGELKGRVLLKGASLKDQEIYEIARSVSSVFQNPKTQFFNLDTTKELLFYLENRGTSREDMKRRLEEVMERFPIRHLLYRNIFDLSGGEKQMLAVAASFAADTPVVVLDEPSANLDAQGTAVLGEMLRVLKARGKTLIVAEHRFDFLHGIVDRAVLFQEGQMEAIYKAQEFYSLSEEERRKKGLRSLKKVPLQVAPVRPLAGGALDIRRLRCAFPQGGGVCVQDLSLNPGMCLGIVGPNGCGKTTFLRALWGGGPHRELEVRLHGIPMSKRRLYKKGYWVMQDVNHQLFTDSVGAEVRLGMDEHLGEGDVSDVLQALDLDSLQSAHPMALSGGQKQRVAIASALLSQRPVIAFDEPTSGMDYGHMTQMVGLLDQCAKKGRILFAVSHDYEFINACAQGSLNLKKASAPGWPKESLGAGLGGEEAAGLMRCTGLIHDPMIGKEEWYD